MSGPIVENSQSQSLREKISKLALSKMSIVSLCSLQLLSENNPNMLSESVQVQLWQNMRCQLYDREAARQLIRFNMMGQPLSHDQETTQDMSIAKQKLQNVFETCTTGGSKPEQAQDSSCINQSDLTNESDFENLFIEDMEDSFDDLFADDENPETGTDVDQWQYDVSQEVFQPTLDPGPPFQNFFEEHGYAQTLHNKARSGEFCDIRSTYNRSSTFEIFGQEYKNIEGHNTAPSIGSDLLLL
jgi:hypothetical protein